MAMTRMLAKIGVLFILFAVSTNASPSVELTEMSHSMSNLDHCTWDCNIDCLGYKKKEDGCPICECDETVDQVGDIKINDETRAGMNCLFNTETCKKSLNPDVQSAATTNKFRKWNNLPDGNGNWYIPYEIDSSITSSVMNNSINQAISDLEENACFRFRQRVTSDQSYISFGDLANGCWSYVGRLVTKPNQIQLDQPGCNRKGTVLHEILHALGFLHEHSRPDRDSYVIIYPENILPGRESNFLKQDTTRIDSLGSVYDYMSVMHYSPTAFSIDRNTKMTITNLEGNAYTWQRNGLAVSDIFQLRAMYKCERAPTTTTMTTEPTPMITESTIMTTESTTMTTESMTMTTESTTMTPEPTTMFESTTTALQLCEDKIPNRRCRRKMNKGQCSTRHNFMKRNCAKTCKFCDCKDFDLRRCQKKKNRGHCETKFRFMAKKCPKACGLCITGNI